MSFFNFQRIDYMPYHAEKYFWIDPIISLHLGYVKYCFQRSLGFPQDVFPADWLINICISRTQECEVAHIPSLGCSIPFPVLDALTHSQSWILHPIPSLGCSIPFPVLDHLGNSIPPSGLEPRTPKNEEFYSTTKLFPYIPPPTYTHSFYLYK